MIYRSRIQKAIGRVAVVQTVLILGSIPHGIPYGKGIENNGNTAEPLLILQFQFPCSEKLYYCRRRGSYLDYRLPMKGKQE